MKNALLLILFIAIGVHAQGTIADYERANGLRQKYTKRRRSTWQARLRGSEPRIASGIANCRAERMST